MTNQAYKSCVQCGESKPRSDFYRDKRNSDGLGSYCKRCHLEHVKRWKEDNRAANNAYRAEWARRDRAMNPEKAVEARRRFFESKGPTYRSWRAMLTRCINANQASWQYYGGRGITVCERWRGTDGFLNFLADMGERPEGRSLDRIDVDGNYEPGNCRWATATEQSRNQRRHRGKVWAA